MSILLSEDGPVQYRLASTLDGLYTPYALRVPAGPGPHPFVFLAYGNGGGGACCRLLVPASGGSSSRAPRTVRRPS
ncbi:MAG TPA: hypothetical protein VLM05_03955, partial [Mycobacteriales bacterium]|nr:hypothetical protein [Mycobacteriales bacterium]